MATFSEWRSPGIRIYGKLGSGVHFATATDMDKAAAKAWFKVVNKALNKLAQLNTGSTLINEINGSGQICYIMKCAPQQSSATIMNPQGATGVDKTRNLLGGLTQGLVPYQKIAFKDPNLGPYNPLKAMLRNPLNNLNEPSTKGDPLLAARWQALIHNMNNRGIPNPVNALAITAGLSLVNMQNVIAGVLALDREAYYKIAIQFYDDLPRGGGTSMVVQFCPSDNQRDEPDSIMLGHELIHAWRMMTGRRIVATGACWEEEAMTVGLAPFTNLRITENRLRAEARLKTRTKYGGMVTTTADFMNYYKNMVESSTVMYAKR